MVMGWNNHRCTYYSRSTVRVRVRVRLLYAAPPPTQRSALHRQRIVTICECRCHADAGWFAIRDRYQIWMRIWIRIENWYAECKCYSPGPSSVNLPNSPIPSSVARRATELALVLRTSYRTRQMLRKTEFGKSTELDHRDFPVFWNYGILLVQTMSSVDLPNSAELFEICVHTLWVFKSPCSTRDEEHQVRIDESPDLFLMYVSIFNFHI